MFSPNPFLQLVPNRVAAALRRLVDATWARGDALVVEATLPRPDHLSFAAARRLPRRRASAGHAWGRLFDQRWCRILVPSTRRGANYFEWSDQGEATLYIDGVPYYGFDIAHRRVRLPAGGREVWIE